MLSKPTMTNAQWFMLVGGLLLVGALPHSSQALAVTAAMFIWQWGCLVGPSVLIYFISIAQGVSVAGDAD